jgi:hypothetical protein
MDTRCTAIEVTVFINADDPDPRSRPDQMTRASTAI